MRWLLAIVAICISTMSGLSDEPYQRTSNTLGECIGQQARLIVAAGSRIITADAFDDLLKQKCGYLEEQQENEFYDFLRRRIGRTLSPKEQAETLAAILAEFLISHTRGGLRRATVDTYKSVIINRK